MPELVRGGNGYHALAIHLDLQILVAGERPLELGVVVVLVLHEVVEGDGLELFLLLDLLARDILHHRHVVDGLHGEHGVALGRSAFRVSHGKGHLLGAVPLGIRSLDGRRTVLVDINLQLLVASDRPLQVLEIVVSVTYKFSKVHGIELLLFFNHLVRNLLESRHVVHGGHGEHGLRRSLRAFRVRHGKRDFFGTVPVLVRDRNLRHHLGVNFNVQASFLLLGTGSGLDFERPGKFRRLVVEVSHHFAKLDGLELFLFLDGLRLHLLYKFRNVVHGFNRVGDGALVGCAFRVSHLDGERLGAVPLRARRRHLHHAVAIDRNLEFAVARDGPLEFILTVVEVIDILVEFNRLELLLFLHGLFRDILHDRRVVDGLHGKLHRGLRDSPIRVGRRERHGLGTVPEFVRGLERDLAGLLVDVDLDILVAGNLDLQLRDVVVRVREELVKHDGRKFGLLFDFLVRNLREHRLVVYRSNSEGNSLLDRSAFRVGAGEGRDCGTVPVLVRNLDGGNAALVDIHVERAGFRFLALVLHVHIPGEFGILVVGILHEFVQLDLLELLLLVNSLVRNLLCKFRLVVHGVHREASLRFGTGIRRVAHLELERLGTVPELVRNTDGCNATGNLHLQVLVAGDFPLELFHLVVRVLHELRKFNRLEFLLFFNRLFRHVLRELRRVVDGLHREGGLRANGRTSGVGRREGHCLGTVPEFVRNLDVRSTVLVDIELEVLVACDGPLEFRHVIIDIGNEIGQGDGLKLVLLVDGLVRNLLDYRGVVDGLHRKEGRLLVARILAVSRRKRNLCSTVPVGIGDNDGRHALRVNFDIQVAVGLILTCRLNVEFPKNLVLRVVRVGHEVVELDLRELLAFVNRLLRDILHHRRVVHGLDREIHRLGTNRTLRVLRLEGDVFGTVPVLVGHLQVRHAVGRNSHLDALVARNRPLELRGLIHIVGHVVVELDRRKLATLVNRFARNPVYRRGIVFYRRCTIRIFLRDNDRG